jgi:general secretion pathway protein J
MKRQSDGFTLLELMIAMALFGLLAMVLAGGLRFGLQAWNRLDRAIDRAEPIMLVQNLLRREIEQAAAWPVDATSIAFAGSDSRLRFLSVLPERAAAPGVSEITLALEPDTGGSRLVLSWVSPRPSASGRKVLLEGIASGGFVYYGSIDPSRPADWQQSWEKAPTLPRLVALRLAFRDAERRWPTLMVELPTVPDSGAPAT